MLETEKMWGLWEGEACQEFGDLGEGAGDHLMSFFPAKAVLTTLVGSLGAGEQCGKAGGTHKKFPPIIPLEGRWQQGDGLARKLAKGAERSNKRNA